MFPLARVPFQMPIFDPQPNGQRDATAFGLRLKLLLAFLAFVFVMKVCIMYFVNLYDPLVEPTSATFWTLLICELAVLSKAGESCALKMAIGLPNPATVAPLNLVQSPESLRQ